MILPRIKRARSRVFIVIVFTGLAFEEIGLTKLPIPTFIICPEMLGFPFVCYKSFVLE